MLMKCDKKLLTVVVDAVAGVVMVFSFLLKNTNYLRPLGGGGILAPCLFALLIIGSLTFSSYLASP